MIPLSQLDEKLGRNFMVILTLAALGAILSVTEVRIRHRTQDLDRSFD